MQYRTLPGTNIKLSLLAMGTMMFGGQTPEAESIDMMHYALDQGVTYFDTANAYNKGMSEVVVGKALKARRSHVVLATKVGYADGQELGVNRTGLSRHSIIANLEESLRRLDTDYIDIYYLHAPDYETDISETMAAMDALVRSGKVRYVGVSNYAAWQVADVLAACDKRGYVGAAPVISQNVLNLLTRGMESELTPCLQKHRMGLCVYNPLAAGLLTGKHKMGAPEGNTRFANEKTYFDRYWNEKNFTAVDKLSAIAAAHGESLLGMSFKWCLQQPCITSLLVGASRMSQLVQNIALAQEPPLSAEALQACDAVWEYLAGKQYPYFR